MSSQWETRIRSEMKLLLIPIIASLMTMMTIVTAEDCKTGKTGKEGGACCSAKIADHGGLGSFERTIYRCATPDILCLKGMTCKSAKKSGCNEVGNKCCALYDGGFECYPSQSLGCNYGDKTCYKRPG